MRLMNKQQMLSVLAEHNFIYNYVSIRDVQNIGEKIPNFYTHVSNAYNVRKLLLAQKLSGKSVKRENFLMTMTNYFNKIYAEK